MRKLYTSFLFISFLLAGLSPVLGQTLTAEDPVSPGDNFPITSTGWPPNTEVDLVLKDGLGALVDPTTTVTTYPTGNFPSGITYLIPTSIGPGDDYDLVAEDPNGNSAQDVITITSTIQPDANNILYVDKNVDENASGYTGDGSSWANALPELADALKWAREQHDGGSSGWDEANPLRIFVAKGEYKPLYNAEDGSYTTDGGQDNAFVLVPNVQLYGGFDPANGVVDLTDDRILPSVGGMNTGTTLSGDLNGDDGPNFANYADNTYHVMLVPAAATGFVVDGVTLRGGNANGGSTRINVLGDYFARRYGGGLNNKATGTVRHTQISDNQAISVGSPVMGGGLFNVGDSHYLTLILSHNHSDNSGGGMTINSGSPSLVNTVVTGNSAGQGGGIDIFHRATANLTNVSLTENTADGDGGGIYIDSGHLSLANSILWGNSAPAGAGIFKGSSGTTVTVSHSIVQGGTGGGLNTNPLFADPTNGDYSLQNSSPAINAGDNTTYEAADGDTGNNSLQNDVDLAGNARLNGSAIDMGAYERAASPINPSTNNILYVNTNISGGNQSGNSWANAIPELADALKWARQQHDAGNGWTDANPLQIWVAEGTYIPLYKAAEKDIYNYPTSDRVRTFIIVPNVQLYGGFPNSGNPAMADRHLENNSTVLSGDFNNTPNKASDNAYHVLIYVSDVGSASLDGFIITRGVADDYEYNNFPIKVDGEYVFKEDGGGIYNAGSSLSLTNTIIEGNYAIEQGGGMYNTNSSPVLDNVSLTSNTANYGGGMSNIGSSPNLTNVTITSNSGYDKGGGMFNSMASPILINTELTENAAGDGGGMYNTNSSPVLFNVHINNNLSGGNGGGMFNESNSSPILINTELTKNAAGSTGGDGGAMYNIDSSPNLTNVTVTQNIVYGGTTAGIYSTNYSNNSISTLTLVNSVVYNNAKANSPPSNLYTPDNDNTMNISYSLLQGDPDTLQWGTDWTGTDGGNNIITEEDPFTDALNGDYSLQATSPAIDAGTVDTTGLGLPAGDITGNPRILGTAIDMGAWEGPLQVVITGTEGWRMMSAPAGGLSYAALLEPLWLQGVPGGDVPTGFPNLYTWDETGQVFQPVGNTADVPAPGQGFIVYVYDDQDYDGAPEGFPKILALGQGRTGGAVSPPLTFTPFAEGEAPADTIGFNLVGNPYGVSIDWDAGGWTKTNLEAPFYVWSDSAGGGAGAYLSWNGAAGTLPDGLITPWQGFWVQAVSAAPAPALEFTEGVRSTGGVFYGAPGEGPTEPPVPQVRFMVKQEQSTFVGRLGSTSGESARAATSPARLQTQQPDGLSSQAVVMFDAEASAGKDRLDAWKLASLNPDYLSLYTTSSEGYALDINALPAFAKASVGGPSFADSLQSALEVALGLEGSALGGAYTLSWSLQAMPEGWSVTLTDLYTNMEVELGQTGEYEFSMESGQQVETTSEVASTLAKPGGGVVPTVLKGKTKNHRFTLRVSPTEETNQQLPAEISVSAAYPNPFARRCSVDLALPETAHVRVVVYDVLGRKITTVVDRQMEAGYTTITMDAGAMGVASGVYLCRIQIGDHTETMKMTLIK